MCGIAGFTNPQAITTAHHHHATPASTIKSMCDIIAHRGPDGEGYLLSEDVVFGHRRLSLVDLAGGAQPMSRDSALDAQTNVASPAHAPADTADAIDASGEAPIAYCPPTEYQIVFNGEIYNYQDLREELEEIGYVFSTTCDTEVLLTSYIEWGQGCLSRLRGMFAFAIYDATRRVLFMARDAFGIKPFYWLHGISDATNIGNDVDTNDDSANAEPNDNVNTETNDSGMPYFAFASEIKSLLEYPLYERSLNYQALEQYMSFQYSVLDETFFSGIYKLAPGHFMTYSLDDDRLSCERWFYPDYDIDDTLTLPEAATAIQNAIQDSVSYHKIADVEVGSFLSSGVDSNYLAASLVHQSADSSDPSAPSGVKTFTVGFDTPDGAKYNEIDYAADAAGYLGVEHITHTITPEEFWDAFPKIQWHMDEPLADPAAAALWFVDAEAAKHVKAVLSGEGADEFFGGYPIYQTSVENEKLSWIPNGAKRALASFMHKRNIRGANYLDRASIPVEERFIGNANIFTKEEREEILLPHTVIEDECDGAEREEDAYTHFPPSYIVANTYARVRNEDETTKMQYVDLNHWLVGDILLKTDKMAMAHSLESRVPFLDKEVWKVARTLPSSVKVSHETSKLALRAAAKREMPSDYTSKPKLGFPVPIRVWLIQDEYYDKVKEALTSDTARKFFDADAAVKLLDDHKAGLVDNSRKIWVLYTFVVWYEQYFG